MKTVGAPNSAVFLHVSQPHGAVPDPSGSAPHQRVSAMQPAAHAGQSRPKRCRSGWCRSGCPGPSQEGTRATLRGGEARVSSGVNGLVGPVAGADKGWSTQGAKTARRRARDLPERAPPRLTSDCGRGLEPSHIDCHCYALRCGDREAFDHEKGCDAGQGDPALRVDVASPAEPPRVAHLRVGALNHRRQARDAGKRSDGRHRHCSKEQGVCRESKA
jgi:hypothetical protein